MKSLIQPSTSKGSNHTGLPLNREVIQQMRDGTAEFGPTSGGDATGISDLRVRYAKAGAPVGTMPSVERPAAIHRALDKLGARLQFERSGTRLYEALISKLDAYGGFTGGPRRAELAHIRDEEHHHALLVQDLIRSLEGDPTVLTPCANLQALATRGLCDVLTDPRVTFIEGLDVIAVAELIDNESWDQLVPTLATAGVGNELLSRVRKAHKTEQDHLTKVRGWISGAQAIQFG